MNKIELQMRMHYMIKQLINQFMQENNISATDMINALNEVQLELKNLSVLELINAQDIDKQLAATKEREIVEDKDNGE